MSLEVLNPIAQFADTDGSPLQGGSLYIGVPNTDPTKNPISVYQDAGLTIPIMQPIGTINGQPAVSGTPTQIFLGLGNPTFSLAAFNAAGAMTLSLTNVQPVASQPASKNLNRNEFVAGTDFTPGVTNSLTLSADPGSGENVSPMYFDAVPQFYPEDFTTSGRTVMFTSPIPIGTNKVRAIWGDLVSLGTPGAGTITDASVAAGAGIQSSKLSYNQGGTGAVTRTIQARLQDLVSVKDFGAVGDGVTDDTAAIQAAMNWLATNGGELYAPPGTYIVNPAGTSVLTWTTAKPFRMRGAGAGASILQTNSTANASIFNITAGTIELSDIGLYGPTIAAAGGTLLTTVVDHKFTRVDFCRYFHGMSLGANVGLLDGCHLGTEFINGPIATGSVGVTVNGYSGGLNITNFVAYVPGNPTITPAAGINVVTCGAVQLTNSNIIRQGVNLLVNPQNGQTVASLMLNNVFLDSAQTYNLWIAPGTGGSVVRTYLTQVECSSSAQDGININGINGTVDGVSIASSQANFCAGNGITVVGANAKNIDIGGPGELVNNVGAGLSVNSGASVRATGLFAGAGYGGSGNGIGIFADAASTLKLKACNAIGSTTPYSVQPNHEVLDCDGFTSANTGSSAIAASTTSIVVAHGLGGTPGAAQIQLTPNVGVGSNAPFVDTTSINATNFTVRCASAPAGALNFAWRATCNGQQ